MATLSQVTSLTRKILEYVGIVVGGILLLMFIFSLGSAIKQMIAPTPPPPPTVSFGKLPTLAFPDSLIQQNLSITYTINTLSGNLPSLPDRITVYKFASLQAQLLGLNKAKTMAKAAGFSTDPTALSETSYKWTGTDPLSSTLTMDIQSFDYTLISSYLTNSTVLSAAFIPDETLAEKTAQNFFTSVSPLPDSIDSSKTKTTLLAIKGSSLVPASSLSNAQIIRVDFFPQNVNTLPIYTPNPSQSLIYALVASSDTTDPQIVEAQYFHKDLSTDKATYPIKTAQQAFNDLKNGKGYIAAYGSTSPSINITDVTLGYYVDTTPRDYLMPVIVFEGDNGFFAYVSAIDDKWLQ